MKRQGLFQIITNQAEIAPKKLSSIQHKSLPNRLTGRFISMPQNDTMTSWPLRAIRKERCLSIIQQQFHVIKKPVVSVSLSIQVTSSNMQLQTRRHLQWYDFFFMLMWEEAERPTVQKNNCVNLSNLKKEKFPTKTIGSEISCQSYRILGSQTRP